MPQAKYFAYILTADAGFAPHPFFKLCTLACCKPRIRKRAAIGDWVFGLGSAAQNLKGRLIYAMKITDKLPLEEYWQQHPQKRPGQASAQKRGGDNIYHKNSRGQWIQEKSLFHSRQDIKRDTGGRFALISNHFFYFGENHIALSKPFQKETEKLRQGHKHISPETAKRFIKFLEKERKKGRHGWPLHFEGEASRCAAEKRRPLESNIIAGDFKKPSASVRCGKSPCASKQEPPDRQKRGLRQKKQPSRPAC